MKALRSQRQSVVSIQIETDRTTEMYSWGFLSFFISSFFDDKTVFLEEESKKDFLVDRKLRRDLNF